MKTKQMMTALMIAMMGFKSVGAYAQAESKGGGGGDASEERVSEIRSDLLSWVKNGGPKGLKMPSSLTVAEYESRMLEILQPKAVTVTFVENDESKKEELQVVVDGKPKTCRGFYSKAENRPSIVCHIGRFKDTTEPAQYRLIHHEFAGLVNLEQNDGASSDYEISMQITDFLKPETILKLSVKRQIRPSLIYPGKIYSRALNLELRAVCFEGTLEDCKEIKFYAGYTGENAPKEVATSNMEKLRKASQEKFQYAKNGLRVMMPFSKDNSVTGMFATNLKHEWKYKYSKNKLQKFLNRAGAVSLYSLELPLGLFIDGVRTGLGVVELPVTLTNDLVANPDKMFTQLIETLLRDTITEVDQEKFGRYIKIMNF